MTDIVLFHSVLGPRLGVTDAAERLRAAGHTVHTPDLYRGEATFDDYEPAMAFVRAIGYPELMARTVAAAEDLPTDVVYAGFSNGGVSAALLAATRPGARGALMWHAALPLSELGISDWPGTVPVQVHYAGDDPFRDQGEIDSFAADVGRSGAGYEYFEYPGSGHLFNDPSLPNEYDAASAELLFARSLAFLERLG